MTTRRMVLFAAGLGVALPLGFLLVDHFSSQGWWPKWILLVWPAAFSLGAWSGTKDLDTLVLIAMAVLANGVLYGVIGLLVARLSRSSA